MINPNHKRCIYVQAEFRCVVLRSVSGETTNYHYYAAVGLSAFAGLLLVVFVVSVALRICGKKEDSKR